MDLKSEIRGAKSIGISGHIRPDGDCIGACMALFLYLQKIVPKAEIKVYLEEPADVYTCLSGTDQIQTQAEQGKVYDVFFVLDTVKERMGHGEALFDVAKKTINIDHHITNAKGCGDVNYIKPEASSTSELIYELMEKSFIDIEIAKAVYLGIIHDTGILQYSNTSPATLHAVAELIAYGFDFSVMIDETFYEKTYIQTQILGRALLESILFLDEQCIVSVLDKKTMDFYGVESKDLEGIVNQLRIIKGVECAVFLYQIGVMEYKVSMRASDRVDVAKVAGYFGGGGHKKAAGCNMRGTAHDVINNLSLHIARQLKEKKSD